MKTKLLIVFVIISFTAVSQNNKYELNVYASPYVYRLGNLDKQYVQKRNNKDPKDYHYSDVKIYHTLAQEYGINFLVHKENFYYGGGLNLFNYSHKMDVNYSHGGKPIVKINMKTIGIRAIIGRQVLKSTRVEMGMDFSYSYNYFSNKDYGFYQHSSHLLGPPPLQQIYYTETLSSTSFDIIPNLNFHTNLVHNFYLNYGFKLKFWSFGNFYKANMNETKDPNSESYLELETNNKQMHFFIGLGYKFNLKHKK